jgi:hypothetical protein
MCIILLSKQAGEKSKAIVIPMRKPSLTTRQSTLFPNKPKSQLQALQNIKAFTSF